jgi:hypothetical protein
MRRLETYLDGYDNEPLVQYLCETPKDNIDMIKKILKIDL